MTDRTAAEVMCCPEGCEKDTPNREHNTCVAFSRLSDIENLHAAGYMIVPREPTRSMWSVTIDRTWNVGEIYRAMTAEGELK